jgi:hypothetical protein
MCLIIDVNCIPKVFGTQNQEHARFLPVLCWVMNRNGSVIYGGTKYKKELGLMSRYLGIVAELNRMGKLVLIPDDKVDGRAAELKLKVPDNAFDDEHIVAIAGVSKCCVVCSDDESSYPFVKRRDLYPKGVKPPKIYNKLRHAKLCCDRHIVDVCR